MIKRYRPDVFTAGSKSWAAMVDSSAGEYVRYEDHAAEVERLRADVAKLSRELVKSAEETFRLQREAKRAR
jgi:hypothetical protein